MAVNKKSFVLYSDSKSIIDQLPDELAGRLLKHIFAYVNDENPVSDDFMLNIIFEPFKIYLKRDLKKYEGTKDKKSEGGQMGNLKRYHIDLFSKVALKELTLKEAVIIANDRKASHSDRIPSHTIASSSIASHSEEKESVCEANTSHSEEKESKIVALRENGSVKLPVSVSVSVSDSIINTNNNNKAKNKNVVVADGLKLPENENWRNVIAQGYKIKPESVPAKLDEFLSHLDRKMVVYNSKHEFVNHFTNWLPKIQKVIPATGNMINFNGMVKGVL